MIWKKHKYRAEKVSYAGYSFASKLEAALFQLLKLREAAGEIKYIECQTQVHLTKAAILYKPDFKFIDCETDTVRYAESKGFETPEWRIKLRLWKYYGPGVLEIWNGTHKNLKLKETILPGKGN